MVGERERARQRGREREKQVTERERAVERVRDRDRDRESESKRKEAKRSGSEEEQEEGGAGRTCDDAADTTPACTCGSRYILRQRQRQAETETKRKEKENERNRDRENTKRQTRRHRYTERETQGEARAGTSNCLQPNEDDKTACLATLLEVAPPSATPTRDRWALSHESCADAGCECTVRGSAVPRCLCSRDIGPQRPDALGDGQGPWSASTTRGQRRRVRQSAVGENTGASPAGSTAAVTAGINKKQSRLMSCSSGIVVELVFTNCVEGFSGSPGVRGP